MISQAYEEASQKVAAIAKSIRELSPIELENLLIEETPRIDNNKIAKLSLNIIYSRRDCEILGIDYCNPNHQDYLKSLAFSTRCLRQGLEILPI